MITTAWHHAALAPTAKLPPLPKILADVSPEHAQRYQDEQALNMMHHMRLAKEQIEAKNGA